MAGERKRPPTDEDLADHAATLAKRVTARAPKSGADRGGEGDDEPRRSRDAVEDDVDEYELDDDGPDDEDADEGEDEESSQQTPRQRKRNDRGHRLFEDTKRQNDELRSQLAQLQGRIEQMSRQSPSQQRERQEPTEEDREIEAVGALERALQGEIATARASAQGGVLPDEQYTAFERRINELHERRTRAQYRKIHREESAGQPAPLTPQNMIFTQMQTEFPQVMGDQRARLYADAYRNMALSEGRPNDITLLRESLQKAGEKFGFIKKTRVAPQPTQQRRARYVGVSHGAGAREEGSARRTISMGPEQKRMAEEKYPNMPKAEAHAKWAKRRLEKERARELDS